MRPRPDFWGLATAGQLLPKQASKSLPLNQHRAEHRVPVQAAACPVTASVKARMGDEASGAQCGAGEEESDPAGGSRQKRRMEAEVRLRTAEVISPARTAPAVGTQADVRRRGDVQVVALERRLKQSQDNLRTVHAQHESREQELTARMEHLELLVSRQSSTAAALSVASPAVEAFTDLRQEMGVAPDAAGDQSHMELARQLASGRVPWGEVTEGDVRGILQKLLQDAARNAELVAKQQSQMETMTERSEALTAEKERALEAVAGLQAQIDAFATQVHLLLPWLLACELALVLRMPACVTKRAHEITSV